MAAVAGADDVSRLGKEIKSVIVLSNGGIEYPTHNFGIAVDQAANEIQMTGGITPLGQR